MNITVLAWHNHDYAAVSAITVSQMARYCARHGYGFASYCGGFGDRTRVFGFQKTETALALLPGSDVLCVLDCDILITNHAVPLESFIDEGHHFFATHDVNGFNSGAYLIRNTKEAIHFLRCALLKYGAPGVFGEQDAMRDVLALSLFNRRFMRRHPQRAFNSYLYEEYGITHPEGQWEPGDFLLHLPGRSNERRVEIFNERLRDVRE